MEPESPTKKQQFVNLQNDDDSWGDIEISDSIQEEDSEDYIDNLVKEMENDDHIQDEEISESKSYQKSENKSKPQFSAQDCCDALILIQKKIPHRSLDSVLRMLNQVFQQRNSIGINGLAQSKPLKVVTKTKINTIMRHKENTQKFIEQAQQIVDNFIKPSQKQPLGIAQKIESQKVVTFRVEDTRITTFANEQDQQRYIEKAVVAQAFVYRGYGVTEYRSQISEINRINDPQNQDTVTQEQKTKYYPQKMIKIVVDRNKFKNVAGGMVTHAFRKLEQFLLTGCGRSIKLLNRQQMRSIMTVMFNIRVKVQPLIYNIFFKFVKIGFSLQTIQITESEAVKLYVALLKHVYGDNSTMQTLQKLGQIQKQRQLEHTVNYLVKKKEKTKLLRDVYRQRRAFVSKCLRYKQTTENNQKHLYGKQDYWTPQIDNSLASFYVQTGRFVNMKHHLKHKFPEIRFDVTELAIVGRFSRIMKRAIQKMQIALRWHSSQHSLPKLTQHQLKKVIKFQQFKDIRIQILKHYLDGKADETQLDHLDHLSNEIQSKLMQDNQDSRCEELFNDDELTSLCIDPNQENEAMEDDGEDLIKEEWIEDLGFDNQK